MNTFYGNKYKDQCSLDLAQIDLTPRPRPSVLPRIALALVIALIALPALAIPGSTQNPDGSWTGPNGEDLGGGSPAPEQPADRPQSREGNRTGRLTCGCDASGQEWFVILRDGVVTAADRRSCERLAVEVRECR